MAVSCRVTVCIVGGELVCLVWTRASHQTVSLSHPRFITLHYKYSLTSTPYYYSVVNPVAILYTLPDRLTTLTVALACAALDLHAPFRFRRRSPCPGRPLRRPVDQHNYA